ncbi:MAG TPA: aldose 1-epimerase family protein [Micromonosporaceae bacterium]|jgi:aldose 1-epimerase|nr:aldose 1-epimerase family protein [Micromonosporaceae bacterium]
METLPSGSQWQIEADGHRAVVVEVGGGLRVYEVAGQSIVDGYAAGEVCPGSAGQVLAPWPNRVRDGRYTFHGATYQLPLTEPARHNAIHGLVSWLRWSLVERSESTVTVECLPPPQPGYPWPLRLRTVWSVGPDGLAARHEASNLGSSTAPFGLGVHPYLRLPGTVPDELLLRVPARNRLLLDARLLPIGAARVAGGDFDYTVLRPIGRTALDMGFGDVERDEAARSTVRLSTVDALATVDVWADEAFRWWQVYTGDALLGARMRRSVAVEPMTCPPDAFRSGRDVVALRPGDTWYGSWGIRTSLGGLDGVS